MVQITSIPKTLNDTRYTYRIAVNDANFDVRMDSGYDLTPEEEQLMYKIDKAVPLDRYGSLDTPFGKTDVFRLSTGLKTLLNIKYHIRTNKLPLVVRITECGKNVMEDIFEAVDNQDVLCVLEHISLPERLDFDFNVSGKVVHGSLALIATLCAE